MAFFVLSIAWQTYKLLKGIDFVTAIQWSYLQVTVPEETIQTPKSMEHAFDVWAGIHKNPDVVERFFEGYMEAWFSCELVCEQYRVRYILVVPTVHRKFFEGVVYGQYPNAEIKEVEDYSLRYDFRDIEKKFDMYGTEVVLASDDIYPIRTYREFEDTLAEDENFIDPHQSIVEAFTNVREGEEFWVQFLVRPRDSKVVEKWSVRGDDEILKIGGRFKAKPPGLMMAIADFFLSLPGEIFNAVTRGPETNGKEDKQERPLLPNPTEAAKMDGIQRKVARQGFSVKIRLVHISKRVPFHKQSAATALGAFKQFSTANLNSFKPDPYTKTNGPNYFFKQSRRRFRKRRVLLHFQWRDMWGAEAGQMMNAEELATLYHFPIKYVRAPVVERATSGVGSAPENVPFL